MAEHHALRIPGTARGCTGSGRLIFHRARVLPSMLRLLRLALQRLRSRSEHLVGPATVSPHRVLRAPLSGHGLPRCVGFSPDGAGDPLFAIVAWADRLAPEPHRPEAYRRTQQ